MQNRYRIGKYHLQLSITSVRHGKIEEDLLNKTKTDHSHKLGAREDRLIAGKVTLQGRETVVKTAHDLAPNFS